MGILSSEGLPAVGRKISVGSNAGRPSAEGYLWAGLMLPFDEACKHFVVVGATGSGKSITLNLLMQSVLAKFGAKDGQRRRAVVYDAKADLVGLLAGALQLGGADPKKRLIILNPLDRRFSPWDLCADLTTDLDAYEFAELLVPKNEKESSPYFTDAARALVAGVIKRFIAAREEAAARKEEFRWTFRDLILAFESKGRLKQLLDHNETQYLLDHFHEDNAKNFAGVKSTVDNVMAKYRPIAALFESASEPPISLRRWAEEGEEVLVLGNHENAREATDTLNRLIMRQLSKLLIARDGVPASDETWIFLDEVREAGPLTGLRQLLLRGRSKRVAVAMGLQDVEGMYAAYGEHEGAEIIGAAHNLVILHINPAAPNTARWASEVFSSYRDQVASQSTTLGDRYAATTADHAQVVPNVLPIEFVQLDPPRRGKDFWYFAFTNVDGYMKKSYSWQFLEKDGPLRITDRETADFMLQKNAAHYRLKPRGDWQSRFGLGRDGDGQSRGAEGESKGQTSSSMGEKLSKVGCNAHDDDSGHPMRK